MYLNFSFIRTQNLLDKKILLRYNQNNLKASLALE